MSTVAHRRSGEGTVIATAVPHTGITNTSTKTVYSRRRPPRASGAADHTPVVSSATMEGTREHPTWTNTYLTRRRPVEVTVRLMFRNAPYLRKQSARRSQFSYSSLTARPFTTHDVVVLLSCHVIDARKVVPPRVQIVYESADRYAKPKALGKRVSRHKRARQFCQNARGQRGTLSPVDFQTTERFKINYLLL